MNRLHPDAFFRSDLRNEDLGGKSVRGGMVSMVAQAIRFVLGLAGTIVLARLLTPDDFGLVGMVVVITGFAEMFKNAGLSMATINAEHITHEQISTLFWLNLAIAAALGALILAGAPLVAMFYQRPELTSVTAVLAAAFALSGLTIQHQALLYRHMMFRDLAIIQILPHIITLAVTILLAHMGWRYWSLVVGSVTTVLAATLLTFYFCPWIPGPLTRRVGTRNMIAFGGYLTASNIARYLSENMDKVIIGKFIGATPLGLYTKAYQLFMMPVRQFRDPITNVAMPVLSSIRDQPDRYRKYYKHLLDILAWLIIPVALYSAFEADILIRVFLGPQWTGAVGVFRILAVTALISPLAGTQGVVLVSLGAARRFLIWTSVTAVLSVVAFAIGIPFGIEGVAAAYGAMTYLFLLPSLAYCFHGTPVSVSVFLGALAPPLVLALLAAGTAAIASQCVPRDSAAEHMVFMAVFAGLYGSMSFSNKSMRNICWLVLRQAPRRFRTNRESAVPLNNESGVAP